MISRKQATEIPPSQNRLSLVSFLLPFFLSQIAYWASFSHVVRSVQLCSSHWVTSVQESWSELPACLQQKALYEASAPLQTPSRARFPAVLTRRRRKTKNEINSCFCRSVFLVSLSMFFCVYICNQAVAVSNWLLNFISSKAKPGRAWHTLGIWNAERWKNLHVNLHIWSNPSTL